jgi:mRNA-degrading endonuclease RelE of RelBE toxin-antitoxin system
VEDKAGEYRIIVPRKVGKRLNRLPKPVLHRFVALVEQLREQGPVVRNWQNFGKLGKNEYHCHLTYSYVACWRHEKETITIEVYYVGSRENAPY